jgi:hypothetical protein
MGLEFYSEVFTQEQCNHTYRKRHKYEYQFEFYSYNQEIGIIQMFITGKMMLKCLTILSCTTKEYYRNKLLMSTTKEMNFTCIMQSLRHYTHNSI